MILETLWQEFLKILSAEVGSRVVETWFKALTLVEWDVHRKTVHLKAPNHFIRNWVLTHYRPLIRQHLGRLLNEKEIHIVFVDCDDEQSNAQEPVVAVEQNGTDRRIPAPDIPIRPARVIEPGTALPQNHQFDTFVVGAHNSLAYAAAHAVTQNPGVLYNPLLIWGESGLGKTHLLHAIGNRIKKVHTKARVLYQTADRFISEFVLAARSARVQQFRARYKSVDVFLFDDIQHLSHKKPTQEMFSHIVTDLQQDRKQLVLASTVSPRDIPGFSDSVRSRLEAGFVADLQIAPLETRIAILQRKAQFHNIALSEDIAHFIALHVTSNIRDLESTLMRVAAFSSLTREPVTLDVVGRVMRSTHATAQKNIDLQNILKHVSRHYNYSIADLKSSDRSKDLASARHIAAYLMKKLTDKSLREIACALERKDHSTVMHALKKIEDQCKREPQFSLLIERFERDLLTDRS